MKSLVNDARKFEKINLKYTGIVNQEKLVDNILKKLVASKRLSAETRKSLKTL